MSAIEQTPAVAPDGRRYEPEPVLRVDDIQGNIVPGFLKPWMAVLALTIQEVPTCRGWLAGLADQVTTCRQAMETRERVRRYRAADTDAALGHAVPDDIDDEWVAIGISFQGLSKIFSGDDNRINELTTFDAAFQQGLAARSAGLGDPVSGPYAPSDWVVGGPGNEADILLIVAADREESLEGRTGGIAQEAEHHGCTVIWRDIGHKLTGGAEHFGFKDGVSQPGVRGRYRDDDHSYLAQRAVAAGEVPEHGFYGLPGQVLVWPGEFIFGLPTSSADPMVSGLPQRDGPDWSENGSYLVFRRLRQNVDGFRRFVEAQAAQLATQPDFHDWTPERLAAALIGRWPSGAPVSRTPTKDNPTLGADRLANNNFLFAADAPALQLIRRADTYPEAKADPVGLTCPLIAHIRKVNTRQAPNDRGANRATYQRRILRRGLPYGRPEDDDKGLLFLSYQASIEEQFEFLLTQWTNDPANPRSPSGHDLLVGQNGQPGQNRLRQGVIVSSTGAVATITAEEQYINPTGGGYFFAPSISALKTVIGKEPAG